MTESPVKTVTMQELLHRLKEKGDRKIFQHTAAARFPSSIVFFESKTDYREFIQEIPYPLVRFSDAIPDGGVFACHPLKAEFNQAITTSKKGPLVLVPMTEYLRLCGDPKNFRTIFSKILQAEGAHLIVPFLDYMDAYLQFFDDYEHQLRMGEVFHVSSVTDGNDKESAIELVLDHTGMIEEENRTVIRTVKDWFALWEDGRIAEPQSLLIRHPHLLKKLSKAEIAVPRVEKTEYHEIRDVLTRIPGVNPGDILVEPHPKILKFIIENMKNVSSFADLSSKVLKKRGDLDALIPDYWREEAGHGNLIERWFWLNQAHRQASLSPALALVVTKIDDPSILLDRLYRLGLIDESLDLDVLADRRRILCSIQNPSFKAGEAEFREEFERWCDNNACDEETLLPRLTGIFPFEQKHIFEIVRIRLEQGKPLDGGFMEMLKDIWPGLASYLSPLTIYHLSEVDSIAKDWQRFFSVYMQEYIRSKCLDRPTDALRNLLKTYQKQWSEIRAALGIGMIPSLEETIKRHHPEKEGFLFLDCVGYEWYPVLRDLLETKGWLVDESFPSMAELPSTTAHFPLDQKTAIEQKKEFDELIHQRYRYPKSLLDEIAKIEKIANEIHQVHRSQKSRLWILSDHGATAFARQGSANQIEGLNYSHGGRCGDVGSGFVTEREHTYRVSEEGKTSIISYSHNNLGPQPPQGEAHGGGTPEEVYVIAVALIPPGMNQVKDILSVRSLKSLNTPLDTAIELQLSGKALTNIENIFVRCGAGLWVELPQDAIVAGRLLFDLKNDVTLNPKIGSNVVEVKINGIVARTEIRYESGSMQDPKWSDSLF